MGLEEFGNSELFIGRHAQKMLADKYFQITY